MPCQAYARDIRALGVGQSASVCMQQHIYMKNILAFKRVHGIDEEDKKGKCARLVVMDH